MAQLTLHWTETAIRQRNFIFEYWIQRNQSATYAKKLNEKIRVRTNLLKLNPELGVKTTYTIVLPNGYYAVSDINNYLQGQMILAGQYLIDGNGNNVYYLSLQYDTPYYAVQVLSFAVPTALPVGYILFINTNLHN